MPDAPGTHLQEAIVELAMAIEHGELPRMVAADASTLDAIRFVIQQWYPLTDNAGVDLSATAEEVGRAYFDSGAGADEWTWSPSSA